MTSHYDSEFEEEVARLDQVTAYIDDSMEQIRKLSPATAAYQETAEKLQEMNAAELRNLLAARPRPYFGRVNFTREEQPHIEDAHYLGIHGVDGFVTDWTAPIASLYYSPAHGRYVIQGDNGVYDARQATVSLKRTYDIQRGELYSFTDALRLAPGGQRQGSPCCR